MGEQLKLKAEMIGNAMVDVFHIVGLFIIGLTIVWSAANEYLNIIGAGSADLKDILLLFIYLELGAMIGIYFKTKKLPVVFLIYIAITAVTRVLTVDVKTMSNEHLLTLSGATLILALAGLLLSWGKPNWLRKNTSDDTVD